MAMFNVNNQAAKEKELAEQKEKERLELEKKKKEAEEAERKKLEEKRLEQERLEKEKQQRELAEKIARDKEEKKRQEEEARVQEMMRQQAEEEAAKLAEVERLEKANGIKTKKIKGNNTNSLTTEQRLEKMYKSLKYKKIAFIAIILVIILALIIFGTYNTFFKQEKPVKQLASEINAINQDTAFPDYGLQGFLQQNINELVKDKIYFAEDNNATKFSIDPNDLYITAVTKKSTTIANVFFECKISSDIGSSWHSFYLPVKFDWEKFAYFPAGDLEISMRGIENKTEVQENPINSFKDKEKETEENMASAKTFVDNFFKSLYNANIDISQMYKGNYTLGDPNLKYIGITEFTLYKEPNIMGYNAIVKYTVQTASGLRYTNNSYLKLAKSDKTWVINEVL